MNKGASGFSLLEMLFALTILLVVGMMVSSLFQRNAIVIRDQTLIMEMQQTARIVISQIADEVRMAGQGVPVFATAFDGAPTEATVPFLGTSTSSRIDFRAGLTNVETVVTTPAPLDLTVGTARALAIADGSALTAGKFVYLWGPGTESWPWVRSQLVAAGSSTMTIVPAQTGSTAALVHFSAAPTVYLEEGISIFLNGSSVRRATSNDFSNPSNPTWNPANEIGANVSELTFTYYDNAGTSIIPSSLANRAAIARVDIHLTARTAGPLSNGSSPVYSLALRTIPRNVRIRSAN
jgi:prepilin-type N-terminal cleavage/methylation domain-containing protein